MMRTVSRRCCWPFSFLLVFTLLSLCSPPTARLPGKPAFLALDQYSNILYAAGSGAARVTALDPTTCAVQHVFEVESSPLTHITPPKAPAKQASAQKVIMSNILVIVACVLAILFLVLVLILLLQRRTIQKDGRRG